MRDSTNDYQTATPLSLPDHKSISETDFEDEKEVLNPEFYPIWRHGELHMHCIPSDEPESQLDEERSRHLQDL